MCGERASASDWRSRGRERLGVVEGAGRAREGRVEGSLNSDSDRSLCSMRDCVNVYACESASVLSRPSLPLHRAFARAREHTGSSATVCCGCERELSERERKRGRGEREREKERNGEGTAREKG